ncbi:MAG: 30S ribosome-binding factor RbfA [Verrucomicrobiae bacterium]|nr:30S ribosome-binding factor RbfA [Verrucomicrobiae bacterium]MCP5539740.1 30S ribosome-binding factor RbfA [Akkermansiaceae bacterium]
MSNRLARVGELLKRELGRCIEREFDFTDALVTVHAVDVTPDLRSAHVFVGVVAEGRRQEEVLRRLASRRSHLQSQMMKRVVLKYTPQLHFHLDNSVERGVKVVGILDELAAEQAERDGAGDENTADWDDDESYSEA